MRRGHGVIYHLHARPVFVTRYRRGAFTDHVLTRCEGIMRDVHFAGSCGGTPLSIIKESIERQKRPD